MRWIHLLATPHLTSSLLATLKQHCDMPLRTAASHQRRRERKRDQRRKPKPKAPAHGSDATAPSPHSPHAQYPHRAQRSRFAHLRGRYKARSFHVEAAPAAQPSPAVRPAPRRVPLGAPPAPGPRPREGRTYSPGASSWGPSPRGSWPCRRLWPRPSRWRCAVPPWCGRWSTAPTSRRGRAAGAAPRGRTAGRSPHRLRAPPSRGQGQGQKRGRSAVRPAVPRCGLRPGGKRPTPLCLLLRTARRLSLSHFHSQTKWRRRRHQVTARPPRPVPAGSGLCGAATAGREVSWPRSGCPCGKLLRGELGLSQQRDDLWQRSAAQGQPCGVKAVFTRLLVGRVLSTRWGAPVRCAVLRLSFSWEETCAPQLVPSVAVISAIVSPWQPDQDSNHPSSGGNGTLPAGLDARPAHSALSLSSSSLHPAVPAALLPPHYLPANHLVSGLQ